MHAIILLAGNGDRLLPLTKNIPKSMVEITDGITLLEYQLSTLQYYGITRVTKVVGYKKEKIIDKFGDNYRGMEINYIENKEYLSTNTAYSLWLTKEEMIKDDFILLNGDVLFHPHIIERIINSPYSSCLAIDRKSVDEEAVKVISDEEKRIQRIGKDVPLSDAQGEFIGVALFSKNINQKFVEKLEEVVRHEKDLEAYFEKAVDRMLCTENIFEVNISDLPAIEIDFMQDYERAKNEIYPIIAKYAHYIQ